MWAGSAYDDAMEGLGQQFDMQVWYLNQGRTFDLLGGPEVDAITSAHAAPGSGHLAPLLLQRQCKDALFRWIRRTTPRTPLEHYVEGTLLPGARVAFSMDFNCRGFSKAISKTNAGGQATAELSGFIPAGNRLLNVSVQYSPKHCSTHTAGSILTGKKHLSVIGIVGKIKGDSISVRPAAIGSPQIRMPDEEGDAFWWPRKGEVNPFEIDQFSEGRQIRVSKTELARMLTIPEKDVKQALAEILGEPYVPNDWGGEGSDLVSPRVTFKGREVLAAFLLKGKARSSPMTMAHLGKNGDQMIRLINEHTDLVIVQHCNKIELPVRTHLRAVSNGLGIPRMYCTIDGYDTVRILKAHGKCGF